MKIYVKKRFNNIESGLKSKLEFISQK